MADAAFQKENGRKQDNDAFRQHQRLNHAPPIHPAEVQFTEADQAGGHQILGNAHYTDTSFCPLALKEDDAR